MSFRCEIFVFSVHDYDVMGQFPLEYSSWIPGGAAEEHTAVTELTRKAFAGVDEARTITTEGLRSPVHGFSYAPPPKYPAHRLTGYRCDDSIIVSVDADSSIVVYSIDTVDPADYDSLITDMQDMRPGDPVKEAVWTKVYNGLIAETPSGDQRDSVTAWLDDLRATYPLGTATQFAVEVRKFTGQQ
jgi:hypothetical protein